MQTTDKLTEIISSTGLDNAKSSDLIENFSNYFEIAKEWEEKSKQIIVNSSLQVEEMQKAREARLFLKQKRVAIEKTRTALKESSLREGKAIDAIAKILTNLITPIEDDLELKEKFKEMEEKKIKDELRTARQLLVSDYAKYIPLNVDLAEYTEIAFNTILKGAKMEYEQEQEKIRIEQEEEKRKQEIKDLHNKRKENILSSGLWEFMDDFVSTNLGTLTEVYFNSLVADLQNRKSRKEEETKKILQENELLRKQKEEAEKEKEKLTNQLKKKSKISWAKDNSPKEQLTKWVQSFELPISPQNEVAVDICLKFDAFKTWAMSQIDSKY
jgi:hypothetical protein